MASDKSGKQLCKVCWAVVILLALVITGMAYKFLIQGSTVEGSDGRISVQLEEGERDLVLAEMRMFVESVQQITEGVANKDMKAVAVAARKVGRAAQHAVPGSVMGKLPVEVKKIGFDTHAKFDLLAMDAEQFGDGERAILQLGALMQNCVACHRSYRLDVAPK